MLHGAFLMQITRILILDDDEPNRLFFETALREMDLGDEVYTARTGLEAMEIVVDRHIQLIITAWELRGMPGTVFIQKAKTARKRKYLPFLIYSKRMDDEGVQLTKDLGIQHIINMPFDKAAVIKEIQTILTEEENIDEREKKIRRMEDYLEEDKPGLALKCADNHLFYKSIYLPRALTTRGRVWFEINKFDKAEVDFKRAIEEQEDYIPAHQLLAKLYSHRGRHLESIQILEHMSSVSPKNLSTLNLLGKVYIAADRDDDAREVFGKVSEMDETNQECKDGQATLAVKEGDLSLAMDLLAQTESGNEMAGVFNSLAISMVNSGDFGKGIDTYRSALHVLSDKAKVHLLHYNLGLALKKEGHLKEAFVQLAKSYLEHPGFEKAYVSMARVAKELKAQGVTYEKDLVSEVKKARNKWQQEAEQDNIDGEDVESAEAGESGGDDGSDKDAA